ncbi:MULTISPECIES: CpaF family protein [Dietzia]|uniref:CpaF family protein n=1 Tax=Dietzia cinnamea TaxID=321318 RepID=A0AAW5Q8R5_9ACTN|nr:MULTISPECIES: CpaF family protein [Dietzia]KZO59210.1 pilus assembly protein CpaF [Dietzia maris]MBM7231816.1 CpaF family protein [Dietzia cinnamea]MCT1640671.1 CpaF family protein [Dietzia cinnamea]MCT1864215.1 CpaF family protein [Dietzia cinnamea]MCT1884686.1 CpaF family protein [Dietzia cinnamea]
MSLSDRLRAARATPGSTITAAPPADTAAPSPAAPGSASSVVSPTVTTTKPSTAGSPQTPATAGGPPTDDPTVDPLIALKERAATALFERIGARLNNPSLTEDQLHTMVRAELNKVVEDETVPLTGDQPQRLISDVQADVLGHGPLEKLLEDPDITEIMVNGPDMIFVERAGQLTRHPSRFTSEDHLRQVIERIVSRIGRRVDESSPLVDARLADGSRVNAVIPPLAVNGSSLTIRKFSKDPFQVHDLIRFGTLTPEMAEVLQACVQARLNIIVSGGTGSGKTTLLNVLSSFIPEGERIVTIEDAVELQLQQDHVVRLESRPANIEGRGEITIRELVRNSLRMRPDRIVVGEVRGGETLDMLQAMNTGHDGSLSTVHSNSPRDAIARLETLVLMAGMDLPLRAIREQIASAVDVIIQLTRLRDGTRRITAVTEVQGMEGQTVTLQDAFLFDYSAGVGPDGKFLGKPVATGVRPRFTDRFAELGITLSPRVFGATTDGAGAIR